MTSSYLTQDFLYEIFKLCFTKKSFLELVIQHVKFQYIPSELKELKIILQSISAQYSINQKLPSYGIVSQQNANNSEVQDALQKIKESDIIDQEQAIKQLDSYLKETKFRLLFEQVHGKYVDEKKKEEAIQELIEGAEELSKFSLKSTQGQFLKVFKDFHQQLKERQVAQELGEQHREKTPFGIDILDIVTDGGLDKGDTALWIMRSGVGKSTALKHTGMYCCRLGYKVLHIQCEGTKDEAYTKYAQIWTGSTYGDIKWGNIPKEKMIKIDKVIEDMSSKERDIEIYAFEKFGSASMTEIRDLIIEYEKVEGQFPDLVIIDSLDLIVPGTSKKIDFDPEYKKDKLQGVAQLMKNIAVEFNTRILTATQTSDVNKTLWNNPDWVIDRSNTEGDKTLVKPFSFVYSGNQTVDEQKKNIMRIHIDKFRNYSVKGATYPICSNFNLGKFYDKPRSLKEFQYIYDENK